MRKRMKTYVEEREYEKENKDLKYHEPGAKWRSTKLEQE